jgi:disulfide bond formation protein DsbB
LLLGFGYILQFVDGLTPCPLCIFQRLAFFATGSLALLAAIHGAGRVGARVYASVMGLAAVIGAGIAARQVWLQHLPADRVPECGPGLDFILEVYPLAEAVKTVLRGSGDCAKVDWTFLGLSIAEWSLASFSALCVLSVLIFRARRHAP